MFAIRSVSILVLAAALLLCSTALAQFSPIPRSGCPGTPALMTTGTPSLGQPVTVTCAPCRSPQATTFMVVGARMPHGVHVVPPLACGPGCELACQPLFVERVSSHSLTIPSDPTLVGACVCIQCGCLGQPQPAAPTCIELHGAMDLCVQG